MRKSSFWLLLISWLISPIALGTGYELRDLETAIKRAVEHDSYIFVGNVISGEKVVTEGQVEYITYIYRIELGEQISSAQLGRVFEINLNANLRIGGEYLFFLNRNNKDLSEGTFVRDGISLSLEVFKREYESLWVTLDPLKFSIPENMPYKPYTITRCIEPGFLEEECIQLKHDILIDVMPTLRELVVN